MTRVNDEPSPSSDLPPSSPEPPLPAGPPDPGTPPWSPETEPPLASPGAGPAWGTAPWASPPPPSDPGTPPWSAAGAGPAAASGAGPAWDAPPWASPPPAPEAAGGWGGYPYQGWQQPYPQPDYPSWPAGAYPPPPPPPRSGRSRMVPIMIAAGLVIAIAAGFSGAGIGLALRQHQASSPSTSSNTPSSSSNPSSSSSGSGGALSAQEVAAAIDPSIVDVVNTLANQQGTAEGTGIIISSSGLILTNNHVIEEETSLTVQVDGQGPVYSATVLGYDPTDDVALIQMNNAPSGLHVAPLGDSSTLNVGDPIFALGNAYGRGGTPAEVTGTVAALDQAITASDGSISESLSGMIEIAADIVPGDSGGPLVDAQGKVVGMDTAGSQGGPSFGFQGASGTQGFSIPINTAKQIADSIAAKSDSGNIVLGSHGPLIGVDVEDVQGVSGASEVQVQGVVSGSPAAKAGIAAGDVITSVNGAAVGSTAGLSQDLFVMRPGQTIRLGWDDASGQQHVSSITLTEGPPR